MHSYSKQRYVTVCLGCDGLFSTVRRDRLTCSGACRVAAHRKGSLSQQRETAKRDRVPVERYGFARAAMTLRPDLAEQLRLGNVEFEDVMPELVAAFDVLDVPTPVPETDAEIRKGSELPRTARPPRKATSDQRAALLVKQSGLAWDDEAEWVAGDHRPLILAAKESRTAWHKVRDAMPLAGHDALLDAVIGGNLTLQQAWREKVLAEG